MSETRKIQGEQETGSWGSASPHTPSIRGKVHVFEKFGKYFAFDIGSGVFSELDEIAWKIAAKIGGGLSLDAVRREMLLLHTSAVVDEAFSDINDLIREGVLFSPDPWHESKSDGRQSPAITSLCLMLAEDCNLRCDYCFVTSGRVSGVKRRMTHDTALASIDFLFGQSHGTQSLLLSYFGGEPLLNFPVLAATTRYAMKKAAAEGKEIRFNITTNGTILNDTILDFLAEHSEVSLLLSVDGGQETHDRHRKYHDGKGSYSAVSSALRAFREDKKIGPSRFSVRGTFTALNHDFTQAAAALIDRGVKDISIEPAIVKGNELEMTEEHLPAIKAEYDRLARFFIERAKSGDAFSFFHFNKALEHVSFSDPVIRPCGAGLGYAAVSYDGSLFPCHRFVGDVRFRMGDVRHGIVSEELSDLFRFVELNKKRKCRECWSKYVCGGGCHRHAVEFNESIYDPYHIECELMKHRMELAAYIFAVLTEREREAIRGEFSAPRRPEFLS